jgi:predicted metal-dependent HD superfamily phosphohydrolase
MEIKEIFNHWKATFSNCNREVLEPCFQQIINEYSKESRYYHNFEHVSHLIEQISLLILSEEERTILINAALFHDVIYVAGSNSNEVKSAEFASNSLIKMNVDKYLITKVCEIIMATSNHESNCKLTQLFLDMDLSILGSNKKTYYHYKAMMQKEHKRIPTLLYKIGRKRFLKSMLSKSFIFNTSEYRNKYEAIARTNLSYELKTL